MFTPKPSGDNLIETSIAIVFSFAYAGLQIRNADMLDGVHTCIIPDCIK
jgi:hypothetical protein